MIKKNKFKLIASSIVILLPILYGLIMWNELPDVMTTHWGADGIADGMSGKAFAVFGSPLILLALHFVCILFTLYDKKQAEVEELTVIIAKAPCALLKGQKFPYKCLCDTEKCKKCGMCLKIGCPAITKQADGTVKIDETMCNGCGLCKNYCKFNAINTVER